MAYPRMIMMILGVVTAAVLIGPPPSDAHPMPHSAVLLDVREDAITARLQLPAGDLELAGGFAEPRSYLAKHLRVSTSDGRPWAVEIGAVTVTEAEQTDTGPYRELVAEAVLRPPGGGDLRRFDLDYDAIVHRVATHVALVSVARRGEEPEQVGVVRTDTRTMTVPPLAVDLPDEPGHPLAALLLLPLLAVPLLAARHLSGRGRPGRTPGC